MQRTQLDLFSGIGGFALACRWLGIETIGFCEIEPYAQRVLRKNFPGVRIFEDVRKLQTDEFPRPWIVTGGYPCQPFSQAGKRRGEEDDRHLWPAMFEIIRSCRPDWVLAENVAGHVSMGLDEVLSDLEGEDYTCQPLIIPACAVDAPHRRDRVWIVANAECKRGQSGMLHHRDELQTSSGGSPDTFSSGSTRPETVADSERDATRSTQREKGGFNRHKGENTNKRERYEMGGDSSNDSGFWSIEPDVGRVAHGIPSRVDRLRGLGNAIVPQVAYEIINAMIQADESAQQTD